ncbi:MAG: peptide chain release factor N(5)-glutamine methyltransferase [Anditalea sp.]
MEVRKLFKEYSNQLEHLYPRQEAESLVFWLFDYFLGLQRIDILPGNRISQIPPNIEQAITKLMGGMPIQYITETAPFYGRDFKVTPSVLIPRNETEEMVHLIIKENKNPALQIMDVGTGSGCIPVSLVLEMDSPMISALDISATALDIAKTNAITYKTAIDFYQVDILNNGFPITNLDILVSNPPYVRESDKLNMHQNVLDHEPHLALFVPNDDPLIFYRAIAKKGGTVLKSGGKLYFEINEALGQEIIGLLSSLAYDDIRLIEDLNGKDRIVVAIKR